MAGIESTYQAVLQDDRGMTVTTIHRLTKVKQEITVDIRNGKGAQVWELTSRGPNTGIQGTLYYRRKRQ